MSKVVGYFEKPYVVEVAETMGLATGGRGPVSWGFAAQFYDLEEAQDHADVIAQREEFVRIVKREVS